MLLCFTETTGVFDGQVVVYKQLIYNDVDHSYASKCFQLEAEVLSLLGEAPGIVKLLAVVVADQEEKQDTGSSVTTMATGRTTTTSTTTTGSMGGTPRVRGMVMNYIKGTTLTRYISNKLTTAARLSCLVQLASIIQILHNACNAQTVTHRDCKPDNVIVSEDGQLTLIDFGLARFLNEEGTVRTDHAGAGTVQYASPEQFDSSEITFKVGCVVHPERWTCMHSAS